MNLAIGVVAGLILVVVLIRVFENRFIFFPPRYPEGFVPPENYGLHVEEVWITTEDAVRLNAWFHSNPSSPKVLLVFHGNAENIGYGLPRLKAFSRLGVSVLAVDYRGYGKSEGSPDEQGVYTDADAAYRYLIEARRFEPKNIFIYGQSLGSAVATDLASRRESGGLIIESSFTSGREVARGSFRIPFLEYVPSSRFDSLAKIARVRAPVLVIHGKLDPLFPFTMGQRLYEAAPGPKSLWIVEGAGHDDVFQTAGERYIERLKKFLEIPSGSAAGGARAPKS